MSGPAILRLSAFAARELNSAEYKFTTRIRWVADLKEDEAREKLEGAAERHPHKQVHVLNSFVRGRRDVGQKIERLSLTEWSLPAGNTLPVPCP